MLHPMFTRGRIRRSAWRLSHAVWTAFCYRYAHSCLTDAFMHSLRIRTPCVFLLIIFEMFHVFSLVKKGAKEFVDQNMLRSQKSRRRRRQPRPTSSSCPGPSGSAEEPKEGDSDHETTSSSGGAPSQNVTYS